MKYLTRRNWACAPILFALSTASGSAQPPRPTIRVATYYTIKADRVADFLGQAPLGREEGDALPVVDEPFEALVFDAERERFIGRNTSGALGRVHDARRCADEDQPLDGLRPGGGDVEGSPPTH